MHAAAAFAPGLPLLLTLLACFLFSGTGTSACAAMELPEEQALTDPAAPAAAPARPVRKERVILRQGRPLMPEIGLSYPVIGNDMVDRDVQRWITNIADTFDSEIGALGTMIDMDGNAPDVSLYALQGSCSVLSPSPNAVSLVFELWTYTGGAHGNLDLIALNYSLINGQRLNFVDIFEDVDGALELLSRLSRDILARRLSGGTPNQMILDGTAPTLNNFASLGLTPEGIRIFFQPYQVAPWSAGAQKVDIPLAELASVHPFLQLWGK